MRREFSSDESRLLSSMIYLLIFQQSPHHAFMVGLVASQLPDTFGLARPSRRLFLIRSQVVPTVRRPLKKAGPVVPTRV